MLMSLFYEIYLTKDDELVCEICKPHHGIIYRSNMGPIPPLHPNCRCKRIFIEVEEGDWRKTRQLILAWNAFRMRRADA